MCVHGVSIGFVLVVPLFAIWSAIAHNVSVCFDFLYCYFVGGLLDLIN
jgi:hypothetical protein